MGGLQRALLIGVPMPSRFCAMAAIAVAVAVASYLPALPAPIPFGAESTIYYIPTKKGDKWVYLVSNTNSRDEDVELIEEVISVVDKPGAKIVEIGRLEDGKIYSNREREASAKGVFQTKDDDDTKLCEPYPLLKIPHKENETWTIPLIKRTLTASGPEEVKVPAGTFTTIRVEIHKSEKTNGIPFQTDWYAPRVGIVKVKRGDILIVMKSFTPAKN